MANKKMGRPKFEVTPELIEQVEHLASRGLTLQQIGRCIGTSTTTICARQQENPEFLEAIKRGRAKGLEEISNALYEKAKGGDTTAQIFFLKNRSPEQWMDRKAIEHSGSIDHRNVEELTREELLDIAGRGRKGTSKAGRSSKKLPSVH